MEGGKKSQAKHAVCTKSYFQLHKITLRSHVSRLSTTKATKHQFQGNTQGKEVILWTQPFATLTASKLLPAQYDLLSLTMDLEQP